MIRRRCSSVRVSIPRFHQSSEWSSSIITPLAGTDTPADHRLGPESRSGPRGLVLSTNRLGISIRYFRVSRLLDELTLARGDGSYPKLVQRLATTWLLVLDDWGLASLSGQGRHDLLEVLDDRYARRGTILASQLPVEHWHDVVGDPTFGDAILDRLLNNAHRITLKGGSMRRLYDSTKETPTTPNHT